MRPEFRAAAREIAARSMVLLKNDGDVLPLAASARTIAVIGPLADARHDMMGNWTGDGRDADVVTVIEGIKAAVPRGTTVVHARGVAIDVKNLRPDPAPSGGDERASIEQAVRVAARADAVVLVDGRDRRHER